MTNAQAERFYEQDTKDYEIEEYLDSEEEINLDELLSIFNEKYADDLDFTEWKESVYDHNSNIELRSRILQLVTLKLLYSRNTVPERGYERAKRFINEFNKKLGLNLSTKKIDEIINSDYKAVEDGAKKVEQKEQEDKEIKKLKRMLDENKC